MHGLGVARMVWQRAGLALCLWVCAGVTTGWAAERLRVLVTFPPLYSFAAQVAGDRAEVECLLPPNVGPHDYAMTPGDARKLAAADVVVINGLGLEEFLTKALATNPRAVIIDSSEGVATVADGACRDHDHGNGSEPAHRHDVAVNPHIWLDPVLAMQQVRNIAAGLGRVDPAHAADYRRNAEAYAARLAGLDAEYREALAGLKQRKVIAFHGAFPYLARRYGLEQPGVFEAFPGKEPTPRYLAGLIRIIREQNVGVLLTEPQASPVLVRQVAADIGVKTAEIDTMETGAASASFYEDTARRNLDVLRKALQ